MWACDHAGLIDKMTVLGVILTGFGWRNRQVRLPRAPGELAGFVADSRQRGVCNSPFSLVASGIQSDALGENAAALPWVQPQDAISFRFQRATQLAGHGLAGAAIPVDANGRRCWVMCRANACCSSFSCGVALPIAFSKASRRPSRRAMCEQAASASISFPGEHLAIGTWAGPLPGNGDDVRIGAEEIRTRGDFFGEEAVSVSVSKVSMTSCVRRMVS